MRRLRTFVGWHVLFLLLALNAHAAPPTTGPATEKRFPPLKIPAGFKATLFACDPLVEYPSVIALGPRPGTLFVAHDYVTGLGVKIVRRDEVRLLQDTDGDGYADKSMVYAKGFNSIQGVAFSKGTVFVMHAPLLTSLVDTNSDGVADKRQDIVKGLGLPPEKNSNRLHCANGVVAGHDGWLYLALGDRGCDVRRPEGDRLLVQEGGILRCRPNGRDLHLFSGGLRNIYDIALDEELNVFVRDNENDGGDYMIRVCRSFFGADHGYPYLYNEHPAEALEPLVDLGRGSSAGGTAYLETAFPKAQRESLFFCEWGRAVVRYHKARSHSHFATMTEVDFAAGPGNDPYGFKPTDLVVDYDGSLLISDWCDGQRPKRGRGRIYRISYGGGRHRLAKTNVSKLATRELISALNLPSYYSRIAAQYEIERRGKVALKQLRNSQASLNGRARHHLLWIIGHVEGATAIPQLMAFAANDPDARVRAQAVRVIADLADPDLHNHRLASGRGDAKLAQQLSRLVRPSQDPRVTLEVVVALSRLHWKRAPAWLRENWKTILVDPSLEHAAMQLLRRADNWPAVLEILVDEPTQVTRLQRLTCSALANQFSPEIVEGLAKRLPATSNQDRRRMYVGILSRIYKKPQPWKYWGFRPAPRAPHTVSWPKTAQVGLILHQELLNEASRIRGFTLTTMKRNGINADLTVVRALLKGKEPGLITAILNSLDGYPPAKLAPLLSQVVEQPTHPPLNRIAALQRLAANAKTLSTMKLLALTTRLGDGPVKAAAIQALARRQDAGKLDQFLPLLQSRHPAMRAATLAGLTARGNGKAASHVPRLLHDPDAGVLRIAAASAGTLKVKNAGDRLSELANATDATLVRRSLRSLRQLKNHAATVQAIKALALHDAQLEALEYLRDFGKPNHVPQLLHLARTSRSTDRMIGIVRTLDHWLQRAKSQDDRKRLNHTIGQVHFIGGTLIRWSVAGPIQLDSTYKEPPVIQDSSRVALGAGADALVQVSSKATKGDWLVVANIEAKQSREVEFLTSASGAYRVWLNNKPVFHLEKPKRFLVDSDRFVAQITAGSNQIALAIEGKPKSAQFRARFRAKTSRADHERLMKLALQSRGNVARGRQLFQRAQKSLCIKCHRIGSEGSRIGPDLTGVGARFSKIHLIESILQPSRTIAPSYASVAIALKSGQVIAGVKVNESPERLTIGDKDGKLHTIPRNNIDIMQRQSKSLMPEDLEKRFSDREFVDLIAFLQSLTKRR